MLKPRRRDLAQNQHRHGDEKPGKRNRHQKKWRFAQAHERTAGGEHLEIARPCGPDQERNQQKERTYARRRKSVPESGHAPKPGLNAKPHKQSAQRQDIGQTAVLRVAPTQVSQPRGQDACAEYYPGNGHCQQR